MEREGSSQQKFYASLPVAMKSSSETNGQQNLPEEMAQTWVQSMVQGKQQAQAAFRSKVDGKVVQLDNPVPDPQIMQQQASDKRKKRHRKAIKPLTSRERRQLGLYEIPSSQQKYELYIPLHHLWTDYMKNVLKGIHNPKDCMTKLIKADFHGCLIKVTRSTCPSHIGIEGIVVKDTKNMFYVITEKNSLKAIPKWKHTFSFHINGTTYTLYGDAFCVRPAERISRKFKATPTIDF